MKLTEREKERIIARRIRKKRRRLEKKVERTAWRAEQQRMDKPGTGCHCCMKTEREVLTSGEFNKDGNTLHDSFGYLKMEQVIQRGLGGEHTKPLAEYRLCAECLGYMFGFMAGLKKRLP